MSNPVELTAAKSPMEHLEDAQVVVYCLQAIADLTNPVCSDPRCDLHTVDRSHLACLLSTHADRLNASLKCAIEGLHADRREEIIAR